MIQYPSTTQELFGFGYELANPTICKGPKCRAEITWWRSPGGLFVPYEEYPDGSIILHYLNCPTKTPACYKRMKDYDAEIAARGTVTGELEYLWASL